MATTASGSSVTECYTTLSAVHLGRLLLQKMGWKEGEGLGKDNSGPTTPLMLDMKKDRKGTSSISFIYLSLTPMVLNSRGLKY